MNTERIQSLRLAFNRSDQPIGDGEMANVYVEARPKGRQAGDRIDDYVVEDHADHVIAGPYKTQEWAKRNGHRPLVARVRHLNDKNKPDHWREA